MSTHAMSLQEIRSAGIAVLARELGPTGMVRFLQQFDKGSGDYSSERHGWLDDNLDTALSKIRALRNADKK